MLTVLVLALLVAVPLLLGTALAHAHGRGRGDAGTEPLSPLDAARAFLHEWLAAVALAAAWPLPLRDRARNAAPRGVAILIPERYCSSAGFWYLRRRLHAAGWQSVAAIQRHGRATDVSVALDACIARQPSGTEIVLVGHGVGGLIAHDYTVTRAELHIRHVVTLGSPHQGSSALPYRLIGIPERAPLDARTDVIAIYSDFDAWLAPVDDAYCPHAFNIAVRGIGHCGMLQSRRVADLIVENLAAPAPAR